MDVNQYLSGLGNGVAVLGAQWGDEGKGKLVDILAKDYNVIARATGGANAGHTIVVDGQKHVFHLMPSGILYPDNVCVIGNGCVIHIQTLCAEIKKLKDAGIDVAGRLFVSSRAHVVFDFHKEIDGYQEESKGDNKVGTTKRGIGPCYADKINRMGVRIGDLYDEEILTSKLKVMLRRNEDVYNLVENLSEILDEYKELAEVIKPFVADTRRLLWNYNNEGRKILFEGANGAFLDIDHGTYPYVTSSNPTTGGLLTGTGIGHGVLTDVIGIVKAYTTRVGAGPFPTELLDELGDQIRENGHEFGSTTGRPRRCGWFDAVVLKECVHLNGLTEVNLTKLDVLSGVETLKVAVEYKGHEGLPFNDSGYEGLDVEYLEMPGFSEDISECGSFEELPDNAKNYVLKIEELIGVPIKSIGIGPQRHQMLFR